MEKEYDILPAIVVVGYNRIDSIIRLINSINNAAFPEADITLLVCLDKSDKTADIIDAVKKVGFKHGNLVFRTQTERLGLKKHIIECGNLTEEYGAAIILEDDLIVSKMFYMYTCQALKKYHDDDRIAGIALYSHAWIGYSQYRFMPLHNGYDVYLGQFSITWGQCWTANQWRNFKAWYESNKTLPSRNYSMPMAISRWGDKSWGKYFVSYIVAERKYYVIPYCALSTNCAEVGEHNGKSTSAFQVELLDATNYDYHFPSYDEAIKYDVFFERQTNETLIEGISTEEICFDLNALHEKTAGEKYLLTMCPYKKLELIRSFGAILKPIEQNVLNDIPGNQIFLYRLPNDNYMLDCNDFNNYQRLQYEYAGIDSRRLLLFSIRNITLFLIEKIRRKVKKLWEKY